jgi:uncharacterized protein with NRDE domain
MCLVILAWRVRDDVPLVVAANRDELFARAAEPVHVLEPGIVGGRDTVAGGTWLATNKHGVVAGLTNQPLATRKPDAPQGGRDPSKRSRGMLPLILARHASASAAVNAFAESPRDYNPCAMLVADREAAFYVELIAGEKAMVRELSKGVHVLENRPLDETSPKAAHARRAVSELSSWPLDTLVAKLGAVLADSEIPSDAKAVHDETQDWRPLAVEAACVNTGIYGTRSSTVVLVGEDVRVHSTNAPPGTAPFALTLVH